MCDAVAVIPLALILAVTVWSALIVTVPVPDAVVVTGGTSLAPVKLISWLIDCASVTFASIPMAAVAANAMTYRVERMIPPCLDSLPRPAAPGGGSGTIAPILRSPPAGIRRAAFTDRRLRGALTDAVGGLWHNQRFQAQEMIKNPRRWALGVALGLAACAGPAPIADTATMGPDPVLPPPQHSLIPTVNVARATGWPEGAQPQAAELSLIHISEPTRQAEISYAVFCLKKK